MDGKTPLHITAIYHSKNTLGYLVSLNAIIDIEDEEGNTKWYVLHAEANAILKVARSSNKVNGATLYLTNSPCKDCSKLVLQAGIKRLVYIDQYKDVSGLEFLKKAGLEIGQMQNLD